MKTPEWKRKLNLLLSSAERLWGTASRVLMGVSLVSVAALPADANIPSAPVGGQPTPSILSLKRYSQKFVLRQGEPRNSLRMIAQHSSHSSHSSHHSHHSHRSHSSGGM
jgi:hypothetical protein